MATSGMLPPSPAEPEPWSEKDFAPIMAFLRHQIGITLETHRMGLLQARLRSRLQVKGFQSFTQFHEQVLKPDPDRLGRAAPDRPVDGQPHRLLSRAGPLHLHGREGRGLAQGIAGDDDPDLVGGLLLRPGTVQHGDGAGRDARATLTRNVPRSGPATCRSKCSRSPPARSTPRATFREFRRPGSGGSSCWAEARARARSGSFPRSATWSSSATSTCATQLAGSQRLSHHLLPERVDLLRRRRAVARS